MYIKLTRMNGRPIWLNASFIVTIEPHERSGGSIVVPIGDGLDYEVKEPPATVLAMLDGAPVPAVVPVPTTDALDTAAAQDAKIIPNLHLLKFAYFSRRGIQARLRASALKPHLTWNRF